MTQPAPQHDHLELAELYAAGALSDAERAHFESQLAAGDAAYHGALAALRPVLDHLADAAPRQHPHARVRAALQARLAKKDAGPAFAAAIDPDPVAQDPDRWVI